MMMTNIERYTAIRKESLSDMFYFQSFLQEAYEQHELSDTELDRIKLQCIRLLADSTDRYNKGESSSVRTEVAEAIMQSNFYTIGVYLKSISELSIVLDMIRTVPMEELYQKGRKLLNTKINVAKQLFQFVEKTRINTPNYTYNATIEEGIRPFFRKYDADFEAHEASGSIDYQLFIPADSKVGVEFMIQYLQNLYIENMFCKRFDSNIIHEVMQGYDEGYKDLLVNIFEQVLLNALGCMALGKDIFSLRIGREDVERLKNRFTGMSADSVLSDLQQLTEELCIGLTITGTSVKAYILSGLPEFAVRIPAAIETDKLQTIFVPRKGRNADKLIVYTMGVGLDDETYRKIVDEVRSCRYAYDKVQIIKSHIKALPDIENIIMDGELNKTEALAVFKMLDDMEIAVLVKLHPYFSKIAAIDYVEEEIRFQRYLKMYVQCLPLSRQKKIKKLAFNVELV